MKTKKPGENSGNKAGIYTEVGPRGKKANHSTVPKNTTMPPTSTPGNAWKLDKETPKSKR